MKIRFILKSIIIAGSFLVASNAFPAGMSISDSPMFVTEALAPNVIISPVYLFDYNEASMMDFPDAERLACAGISSTDCNIITSRSWNDPYYTAGDPTGWRVTPWPGTCVTSRASGDACRMADAGLLYSKISVYPEDRLSVPFFNNYGVQFGGYLIDSLYFTGANYTSSAPQYGSNQLREDPYPEAGSPYVNDLNRGKVRYFRSDKNFLYFNESVAHQAGREGDANQGYQPWPTLGAYTFPIYADTTAAAQPFYNPRKQQQDDVSIRANLAAAGNAYMYARNSTDFNTFAVVNLPVNIGQYWIYDGSGPVWLEESYTRKHWNGTGSEEMLPHDKINFAHWFTYWRSSHLATRGMLANLIYELGPNRADLLGRFRVGINSSVLATINQRITDAELIEEYGCEDDWDAAGCTEPVTTPSYNISLSSGVGLIDTLANAIYSDTTSFRYYNHAVVTNFFKTEAPYRENPSDSTSTIRSCRRNYEIIVTPDYTGLRHDGPTSIGSTLGNADSSLGAPYADTLDNQWGDVGAYGWKTDLMPSMDNNLLPGKRDAATWQHLVRFVVGPKAPGNIFPDSVTTSAPADDILAGNPDWGASRTQTSTIRYTIDDLWHMALNSRGFFYQSNSVHDAVQRLLDAFNDVLVRNVSGSAVATNTTSLQQGALVYQATVESDWKGHLRAYEITEGKDENDVVISLDLDYSAPAWDLAEKVSAQDWDTGRVILSYNGTKGVPFRWDNLGDMQAVLKSNVPAGILDANVYGEKLVEYLRGSGECEKGADPDSLSNCLSGVSYTFRPRNLDRSEYSPYSMIGNPNGRNVLGDIANSNPWLTSAPRAGISDVDFPGYNKHRLDMQDRADVLYVGANDGMLHAVNAATGVELFAYVPSFVHYKDDAATGCNVAGPGGTLINHGLQCLADDEYVHRFYVDGSPFAAEVELGGAWTTVLAGGANKGGKGYYLLDVTKVGDEAITELENVAEEMVLWEFTHPRDLHYTFNLPLANSYGQARQIARMNDGKWALIVGNGYPEDSGKKACLFIIYITRSGPGAIPDDNVDLSGEDYHGTGYHKLCAGVSDYSNDGGLDTNGLSTPTPVDTNGDGKVDVIYAGDLNGNMWRFDVSKNPTTTTTDEDGVTSTTNNWVVAYSGAPLFVAKDAPVNGKRQAITVPPEVTTHAAGSVSGNLVLFGTGKFLGASDRGIDDVHTFYGVWDRGVTDFANLSRSNLFPQLIDAPSEVGLKTVRKQTDRNAPTYCTSASLETCGTNDLGWYWDMSIPGERLTGRVNLISGTVFFNTFYPSIETYDEGGVTKTRLDPCKYGGDGWLMGLNAANGYVENFSLFGIEEETEVNEAPVSVSVFVAGLKVGAALGGTTFVRGLEGKKIGIYSPTNSGTHAGAGAGMMQSVSTSDPGKGRVSWYELMD